MNPSASATFLATERDLAVLLVTHDLGVMSAIADDVAVMRHGEIVESGEREQVFTAPRHGYTRELLTSMPDAEFSDPEARDSEASDPEAKDSEARDSEASEPEASDSRPSSSGREGQE